jgi:capsular exopolysaccharide synthesis family protein
VVLLTSPGPGEGKSTIAWHLATVSAAAGGSVILLEADLRRPSLALTHGLEHRPGLSEALSGQLPLDSVVQTVELASSAADSTETAHLDVIVAGSMPPNPGELLESDRMTAFMASLRDRYDFIVVDTPPTSVVSDAMPLLRLVDGIIVVGRVDATTRDAATRLRVQLANLGAHTLGVVANGVGSRWDAYGGHYSYAADEAAAAAETTPAR